MYSDEYTKKVMDHFMNPRNMGEIKKEDLKDGESLGIGEFGNPSCGDMMIFYIKVKDGIIKDIKFKTFGCASAIASASIMTTLAKGKTIKEAKEITNKEVETELGGLPPIKKHCSNLSADALNKAIDNLEKNKEENNKKMTEKKDDKKITKDMLILEIVDTNPKAAEILFNHGLRCVGCHVAASETLEQGAKAHGMSDGEVDDFVKTLNQ